MVTITEIIKHDHLVGFNVKGHAGYDVAGKDIVCAAVSVLTQNAIETLEEIVKADTVRKTYLDGEIEFEVEGQPSIYADIVLEGARLGFDRIKEAYPDYIAYEEGGSATMKRGI